MPLSSRFVIRTHGTTRENFDALMAGNDAVHDATCVIVKDAREAALDLLTRHPAVIVVGKKKHPEIVGLVSWLDGRAHVVETKDDLADLPTMPQSGVVAQTTFLPRQFRTFTDALRQRYAAVEVKDTICPHTAKTGDQHLHARRSRWLARRRRPAQHQQPHAARLCAAVNPQPTSSATPATSPRLVHGVDPAARASRSRALRDKGNAGRLRPRSLALVSPARIHAAGLSTRSNSGSTLYKPS